MKKIVTNFLDLNQKIMRIHNISTYFMDKGYKRIAYLVSNMIYKKYKCVISPMAKIGKNFKMPHPIGVVIGKNVKIGNDVIIYQNVTIGTKKNNLEEFPKIGDNVTVYANSVIIGKIKIGNNVSIGANSVVIHDIPDNCVVAGVPATILKRN